MALSLSLTRVLACAALRALAAVSYPVVACSQASGEVIQDSDGPYTPVRAAWLAPIITFFTVLTYFAFHEVARELEDPFLHPPNQVSLRGGSNKAD